MRFLWWFSFKTQRFTENPDFNWFIAGFHELAWNKACGHDWAFAWRIACIYWLPKKLRLRLFKQYGTIHDA